MAARGGRHLRPRGPRERYSPGTEDERPQLGGGLGPDLLQRQVDQLGAREGDSVFELPPDEVAKILPYPYPNLDPLDLALRCLRYLTYSGLKRTAAQEYMNTCRVNWEGLS